MDYLLIGSIVYIIIAIAHFIVLYTTARRDYTDFAPFQTAILLIIVSLFWWIAWIAYSIHLIRNRVV